MREAMSSSRSKYDPVSKRALDFSASLVGLLVLSPFLLVTSALVAIKLGTPVIFKQVRPGRNGVPFTILKFRSMTNERTAEGELLPDAERLTKFGRFLRHSSIDELPELLNVLRGDMSLVGPRPLIMEYLDRYTEEQSKRNLMRPGITGLAQVSGRNAISWEERFALDVQYVENWSFAQDLRILLATFKKVIVRDGITAENHASMTEFMGTDQQKDH